MKAGAIDFLTKPVNDKDLLDAIARAEARRCENAPFSAEVAAIEAKIATLTPREREVLTHVIAGRLNKQIAGDLGTVEKTIKVHRGRMMEKLGVHTIVDLVRLAEKAGIKAHRIKSSARSIQSVVPEQTGVGQGYTRGYNELIGERHAISGLRTAKTGSRRAIAGSFSAMPGLADASLTRLRVEPAEPGDGFIDTSRRSFGDGLGNSNGLMGSLPE